MTKICFPCKNYYLYHFWFNQRFHTGSFFLTCTPQRFLIFSTNQKVENTMLLSKKIFRSIFFDVNPIYQPKKNFSRRQNRRWKSILLISIEIIYCDCTCDQPNSGLIEMLIPKSETSGIYSLYSTFMETCILFFSISAILTVFSPYIMI